MSGITPLLDTLLHQVLGWRRDAPVARRLPGRLIMPPRAGQPSAAVHSDSRLDPRAPTTAPRGAVASGTRGAVAAGQSADAMRAGAAAVTRFSAAARAIGDILARFPEGTAIIRAQTPLLGARERGDARRLAETLRGSIDSSGLFYEAHLVRWRNGTYPLALLAREPQMRQSGGSPGPRGLLPAPVPEGDGLYGVDGQVFADRGAGSSDAPVRAGLEGLVRQQLELLGAPVLRWEGEAWSGLFMAIALHPPPPRPDDAARGEDRKTAGDDAPAGWRSTLKLRVRGLGNVTVDLRLGAGSATLDLRVPPVAVQRMEAGSGTLRRRLGAAGFRRVALRIRPQLAPMGAGHG